jgi:hypothetical protein
MLVIDERTEKKIYFDAMNKNKTLSNKKIIRLGPDRSPSRHRVRTFGR